MLYSRFVIDWYAIFINSFWIVGFAILLAAFSYQYWAAHEQGESLKKSLDQPSFLKVFWLAFIFVGIGLAGTSQRWWETAVWIGFIIINLINLIAVYRNHSEGSA